jgi:hypothetical protein
MNHFVFAQVPFKLSELRLECEMLQGADELYQDKKSQMNSVENWMAKSSIASGIESLFTGMEGILKLILGLLQEPILRLETEDGQKGWHAQLIAQVATPTSHRPAIISNQLRSDLDQLRKFRNFERNNYGHMFDAYLLQPNTDLSIKTVQKFDTELTAFIEAMADKDYQSIRPIDKN